MEKDAISFIQTNMNPRKILDYYGFENISETDNSIRASCKIHGGDNKTGFVWNKENDLWICYTGDCHGGDVFNLIEKIENTSFKKAVEKAALILGLDIDGMNIVSAENKIREEQKAWIAKQRKNNVSHLEEYKIPKTKFYDTLDSFTRFDEDTLRNYNAMFCKIYPTENKLLKNKLVIPLYKNNILVGVALRDTNNNKYKLSPKWFYQPTGLKIAEMLYNFDKAKEMILENEVSSLILVEGIFDVWAYHNIGIDNAVAIFGSSIKDEQYKEILKLGVDIVVCFDHDKAGRKCTEQAILKLKNKTNVFEVILPEGKDPADCTKEELLTAYLSKKKCN